MHEGRILKVLIKEKGYTQEEFGKLIGFSRMYITQMVNKQDLPNSFMRRVNDFFKIDIRKSARQFAESKNIVEAFVNVDAAKPPGQPDELTRSQVEALNKYIIDLQRQLLEAKDEIMHLREQVLARQKRTIANAIHSKKN